MSGPREYLETRRGEARRGGQLVRRTKIGRLKCFLKLGQRVLEFTGPSLAIEVVFQM
jgi:hypothetical protein